MVVLNLANAHHNSPYEYSEFGFLHDKGSYWFAHTKQLLHFGSILIHQLYMSMKKCWNHKLNLLHNLCTFKIVFLLFGSISYIIYMTDFFWQDNVKHPIKIIIHLCSRTGIPGTCINLVRSSNSFTAVIPFLLMWCVTVLWITNMAILQDDSAMPVSAWQRKKSRWDTLSAEIERQKDTHTFICTHTHTHACTVNPHTGFQI